MGLEAKADRSHTSLEITTLSDYPSSTPSESAESSSMTPRPSMTPKPTESAVAAITTERAVPAEPAMPPTKATMAATVSTAGTDSRMTTKTSRGTCVCRMTPMASIEPSPPSVAGSGLTIPRARDVPPFPGGRGFGSSPNVQTYLVLLLLPLHLRIDRLSMRSRTDRGIQRMLWAVVFRVIGREGGRVVAFLLCEWDMRQRHRWRRQFLPPTSG